MTGETRRARTAWAVHDAAGHCIGQGEAEAVIDEAGVGVGPVHVAFLDADALRAADYRIELELWPAGRLVLTQLGRRFETFTAALRRARNQARVAGLLAHAPAMPEVFGGAILSAGTAQPAELQVYATHVTAVPVDADPWQLPYGALSDFAVTDDPPAVTLVTDEQPVAIGQLGRRRDAFCTAVRTQRDAQARVLAAYTHRSGFADGLGVPRDRLSAFDALLERVSCADRLEGARTLLAQAAGGEPRLGFVQLLDPDAEALQAPSPLPEPWASFLLVPMGRLVVLEILAGPGAATYIFEGSIDAVNRDLQALHFRRAGLALTAAQAEITPDNAHRLALRRLAPLQRLRAGTRARLVHDTRWGDALASAIAAT